MLIGTVASERWTVEQFKAYAMRHFSKGKGRTYVAKTRNEINHPVTLPQ